MANNAGISPPDYATTVGQVRALIGDTDSVPLDPDVPGQGDYAWYGDAAIGGLLTVYGDSPLRAGAQALRTIASSQALLLKKWSADDLSVDGAAIAEALRKLARDLDDQANNADAAIDIFEISYFPYCETLTPELAMPVWPFSAFPSSTPSPLSQHINSLTPHPAYDDLDPSITETYEEGLL